jgi:thiamine-phosphate pyrophosphorylase
MLALDGGVNMIQLREKSLPARELHELGKRLRRLTAEAGALLIVNDRLDVALAIGADGVQLGGDSMPVEAVRPHADGLLLGRSVHSVAESVTAQALGADFQVLGTIFQSETHPDQPPAGPHLIRKVKHQVKSPVLAIGGITPDNAAQAIADGADGVAVIRAILADEHPQLAARRLVEQVKAAWPSAALHRGA